MKANHKFIGFFLCAAFFWLALPAANAQLPPTEATPTEATPVTESGAPDIETPRDGIYDKQIIKKRKVLNYDYIREADVFWEKRIWRVIDVREKINKPFAYPEKPFITILLDAAEAGDAQLYSPPGDKFKVPLNKEEVRGLLGSVDTIITFDPETFEEKMEVVTNDFNPTSIKRFRLKEVWFFDEETSQMEVRILGIAPMQQKLDDQGNVLFEYPMFWAYYPNLREILARHEAFNPLNDAMTMSWEDIFEQRMFSSYIFKESNVYDRRIQDYKSGIDILFEAEKIKQSIFNFEHDLWSY